ncbi:MAG: hypothetical protein LUG98_06915 [Tannerellaceae bacterium]|nr:hypothetical protein [Tannerellaceae bacterium]
MKKYLCCLLLFAFTGCKYVSSGTKEISSVEDLNEHLLIENSTGAIEEEPPFNEEDAFEVFKEFLDAISMSRDQLVKWLEESTPDEAEDLYFSGAYDFTLYPLPELVYRAVDRIWEMNTSDQPTPLDKQVFTMIEEAGLEIIYDEEGTYHLEKDPKKWFQLFAPYLSEETLNFIRIYYVAHAGDIQMDAGLILTPRELYERCIRWEQFLATNPFTKYYTEIINQYGQYIALLLFCRFDNTPVFDWAEKTINFWALESLQELPGEYPESETERIIRTYLGLLEENNYLHSEELEATVLQMGILKDFDYKESCY